jgi:hypothetical protein
MLQFLMVGNHRGSGYSDSVTTPNSRDPLAGVGGDEQFVEDVGKLAVDMVGWRRRME